jgi:ribosome biogenesis GTPase
MRAEVARVYAALDLPVIATSCETGEGLAALDAALRGKLSVVVGPSGAGESSLLNGLNPGYQLRTGEVMDIGKGRHTTTTTRLLPLDRGGWVADTPGIKTVNLLAARVAPEALAEYFPELLPYLDQCRFSDCSHRREPDCAVRAAVEAGVVPATRYDSYVRLFDELRAEGG